MRLHIGINVNTRIPIIFPEHFSDRQLLDLAVKVEESGYDSVWVGDSMYQKARLEAITVLSAIAAQTHRVNLGTAAIVAPLRHAIWLALTWATLDRISQGRTILGLCVGAERPVPGITGEFEAAGADLKKRGKTLREQIEVIRRVWSPESFDYEGDRYRLRRVKCDLSPVQNSGPPIWISSNPHVGGLSEKILDTMARRIVDHADGWMTCTALPEEFFSFLERLRRIAQEHNRDPQTIETSYQLLCHIANDREKAMAEGTEVVNRYYYSNYRTLKEARWGVDTYGTAEDCVRQIQGLAQAGCRNFVVRFAAKNQSEQLRRFTEDVLPAFR